MLSDKIEIFYDDKNVCIIKKPAGIPCEGDGETLPQILKNQINSEVFLVHRLDRNVGGVMIFAKNKAAAAFLSKEMQSENGVFEKEYLLVTDGIPKEREGVYEDLLFKDSKAGRSFVVKRMRKGVKDASLEYRVLKENGSHALVLVKLRTGRTHQIRVQFSSRRTPLCGDGKYGSRDNRAKYPALFAARLKVKLPDGNVKTVLSLPDFSEYPWNAFEDFKNETECVL